ncbi:DUF1656 domain-containing protein [Shewanella olleyana]|uniref:DUF1656 domain-containing protein n=1 Tax=Shewanella olleyana TaxID=135626 RepID=UPI00200E576C|nr:DUF1656 domain-containing protein [Shewanella olleyana]MCL1065762.1 DUF1656 domain-containing protein [Shewanella olleyana]
MPHEIALGEVYCPPLMVVIVCAYLLTVVVMFIANRLGWHRTVVAPAIVEISVIAIFALVLSQFIAIT